MGWVTPFTPSGVRGRGRKMYFDEAEFDAFMRGGREGAEAYRQTQAASDVKKSSRRSRKQATPA
jgi:hypothetical protein